MKLNSVERATLKWLLTTAQAVVMATRSEVLAHRLGHAEEIIKRITVRPCNAKKMKKP